MSSDGVETKAKPALVWFDSAIITAAVLVAVASALGGARGEWLLADLLFWCLLSMVLQGSSVATPGGFTMGHGYLAGLIAILVFREPLPVMLVHIAGSLGLTLALRRPLLRRLTLFNVSQVALAGAAGVYLLRVLPVGGDPLQLPGFLSALPAVALVGLVTWLANLLLAATHLFIGYGEPLTKVAGKITAYWFPSLLVTAPLALLGASLYVTPIMGGWGGWGVLALMLPVYLTRALWVHYSENQLAHADTLTTLVASLEQRDSYTYGHSHRVTQIALAIGHELELPAIDLRRLHQGAILHDIGKVAVRDQVLHKPGPLSPGELAEMRAHVELGVKLLGRGRLFQEVRPIVSNHQERWDGTGYPQGLRGEAIPLLARIIAVADAYEAMTSDRAYRPAMTPEAAMRSLRELAGSQHDPHLVATFERLWSRHPPWREKRLTESQTTADEAVAALLS